MDQKKYQVFVSSTFKDLQKERHQVMKVLLEMDCIPSGMELFPAANEDQWSLIKGVIDDCDYYIVIVAGRYGSTDDDGIGYTEKEYRYALKAKKPVIAFLHKDPGMIPNERTEQTDSGKEKLDVFRALLEQRACRHWKTPHELGSAVVLSLTQLRKKEPGIGWIRADQVPKASGAEEILRLRKTIEELRAKLSQARTEAPPGTDHLAKGKDVIEIKVRTLYRNIGDSSDVVNSIATVSLSWDEMFFAVSPLMIDEASESDLGEALADKIKPKVRHKVCFGDSDTLTSFDARLDSVRIDPDSFGTIIVQLRALGLIAKSVRTRSVKDTATYWALTPYGDNTMNSLRAIRRPLH